MAPLSLWAYVLDELDDFSFEKKMYFALQAPKFDTAKYKKHTRTDAGKQVAQGVDIRKE